MIGEPKIPAFNHVQVPAKKLSGPPLPKCLAASVKSSQTVTIPTSCSAIPNSRTLRSDAFGAGHTQITATIAARKRRLLQKSDFCFAQLHFRLIQLMRIPLSIWGNATRRRWTMPAPSVRTARLAVAAGGLDDAGVPPGRRGVARGVTAGGGRARLVIGTDRLKRWNWSG